MLVVLLLLPVLAIPTPVLGRPRPATPGSDTLRQRVGAKKVPIDDPCLEPAGASSDRCRRSALQRTRTKLDAAKAGQRAVRILHLGDSHVTADHITSTIRTRLQSTFGDPGRGFTVVDQLVGSGGRRLDRKDEGWEKDRIVDKDREGRPFGFSGVSIESKKKNARATFRLLAGEDRVRVYYQAHPDGAAMSAYVDGGGLGRVDTASDTLKSLVHTFELASAVKGGKGGKAGDRRLELVAGGPGLRIFGLSFESGRPGVYYESVGPLGADAKVYLDLDVTSFKEHLIADAPDLVVLMVGGNDALKIRKGWTSLIKVKRDHEALVDLLKTTLPDADCLVWSPMDAGEKQGSEVVSKAFIHEVRDLQQEVAKAKGCAFWDLHESMGGTGSIVRWQQAKVMNADLVHPLGKAAELLGDLFVEAWFDLDTQR